MDPLKNTVQLVLRVMLVASRLFDRDWIQLLTRSLQTSPYTAMREGAGAGGGGAAGGGAGDMTASWGPSSLPPSAGYYSYDHPSLAAYR